jgi:hypothetical protein
MRVNLIGNFTNATGLFQDASILRGLLTIAFGEKINIFKVPHQMPQCNEAEVNIFIEIVNPSLLVYAARNIWIPNHEWTYRSWQPYLSMMNEIWVKTHEAEAIFSQFSNNVRYIGWTSIDQTLSEKKNYSKALVLVGKNIFRVPKQLLRAYARIQKEEPSLYKKLPELHVPYDSTRLVVYSPPEIEDKVKLLPNVLKEGEYSELLKECGLAICLSATEGFGHAINEAMSSGCNLMLSPIHAFRQLTEDSRAVLWMSELESIPHPECYGSILDVTVDSIVESLKIYVDRNFREKQDISKDMRRHYEERHQTFVQEMKDFLPSLETPEYVLAKTLPAEDQLPDVTVITITKDRRIFMPLAKYSFMIQSYPENKLEWVIVDDGADSIEDTLIGVPNVKYIRSEKVLSIGEKRNLGVQSATYDTIVMMDDDDVYPNNSVLHRVAMMMSREKECAFCTVLPSYDIVKYSSFINFPPPKLGMSERLSEATLTFSRKFWEERNFSDIQIAEGNAFIHGREQMCMELSPQDVIVSLVHPLNTSSRRLTEIKEPNGCHFGFNDNLYAMVSQIGAELSSGGQKESGRENGDERACVSGGDLQREEQGQAHP